MALFPATKATHDQHVASFAACPDVDHQDYAAVRAHLIEYHGLDMPSVQTYQMGMIAQRDLHVEAVERNLRAEVEQWVTQEGDIDPWVPATTY